MRVVLTGETAADIQHLRPKVNGLGLECDGIDCVSFENLRLRLTSGTAADLVVVRPGEDQLAGLLAVQHATSSRVPVLMVTKPDPDFQDQARRAGALGFLDERNFQVQLQAALEGLYQQGAMRARRGRLFVVTSAQGGNGATTTATALAFALGVLHPNESVLAELHTGVPELALDLDLAVKYGLGELLDNWERSDLHMVRQVAVRHATGGVQVLAYLPETLMTRPLTAAQMRHVVVLLRELCGYVVLDLGHSPTPSALEAMRFAESIVVVVRPEVTALRLTRAYLVHLRDQGIAIDRIRPVVNQAGHRHQVDRREVERVLGIAPVEWVNDDPGTVIGALTEGQPLAQYYPRAKITRTFERLARLLDGAAVAKRK